MKTNHLPPKRFETKTYESPSKKAKKLKSSDCKPCRNRGNLSGSQTCQLLEVERKNSINKHDQKWLAMLRQLKEYKCQFGNCVVPRGFPDNPQLANWVAEQRKQYNLLVAGKESRLTKQRVAMLNELEFSWDARTTAWDSNMNNLQQYKTENGNCHVPLKDQSYPKLGIWVKEQRRQYMLMKEGKPSHMTPERIQELDALGFCWDTNEASWLERFEELLAYKDKFGTCSVPSNSLEYPKLATWVHHQRRLYRKMKAGERARITEMRIHALEDLGFVWYPRRGSMQSSSSSGYSGTASISTKESSDESEM